MFREKTLFVVGAGASAEAGLPTGLQLRDKIKSALDYKVEWNQLKANDEAIWDAVRRGVSGQELNEHLAAARMIINGLQLANSIDAFMDMHSADKCVQACGKLAILRCILEAEAHSKLKMNNKGHFDIDKLEDTWFHSFARILVGGVRKHDVERRLDDIAIICFNYDRCIEVFLPEAIRRAYGIDLTEARSIAGRLRILHPYGTVGKLDGLGREAVPFAHDCHHSVLLDLIPNIQTYTERIEDENLLKQIRQEVTDATTIIFLGFHFHPDNMKLLEPEQKAMKRVFATAYERSEYAVDNIRSEIMRLVVPSDHFSRVKRRGYPDLLVRRDLKCSGLFDEYEQGMSASR